MAATLKEIAKLCGVSVATVSLALNDKPVSAKTKQRILAAAKQLGYQPSGLARGLRTQKTYTIGLTLGFPNLEFVDSVVRTARERNYHVITQPFPQSAMEYDLEQEQQAYEDLLRRRVDGVVIWPSELGLDYSTILAAFRRLNIPAVIVDRQIAGLKVPTFLFDNRLASKLAWLHLHKLQRNPIIYLDFQDDYSSVRARREGVRDAHLEVGARWHDEHHIRVLGQKGIDLDGIHRAIELARGGGAIFAAADHIAFAVLRMANEMEIAMPQELALVGFEDVVIWLKERVGWTTSPPLTTIRMRFDEVGRLATEHLLTLIENRMDPETAVPPDTHYVAPQMVVRRSCGGEPGIYAMNEQCQLTCLGQEEY